jgi:peptidyl-prolyl cis-trans isomerase A (cyclophilin A)
MLRSLLALSLILPACSEDPAPVAPPPPAPVAPAAPTAQKAVPVPTPLPADAPAAWTDPSLATAEAPASFKCRFLTSKGSFVIQATRAWAPHGADRFYNLCQVGFFNGARFFRNVDGFMVQWGVSAYPAANDVWSEANIPDDKPTQSNTPGMVSFAATGKPDSRSTQVFINHGDNSNLDAMGFAPFGQVVEGLDVVGQLYQGYGEGAPRGRGPNQGTLAKFGEAYLADVFPKLDTILSTAVE